MKELFVSISTWISMKINGRIKLKIALGEKLTQGTRGRMCK